MTDFLEFLKATSYPGRGILVGRRCVYYFIMGRSENSRNRVFVKTEDGIRTEAHDPAKLSDPSLIIYHPVRTMGRDLVVTNGDQTDTICQHGDFRRGLMTREYEPDEPNWTPRISAIMHEDGSFELSILKRKDGRCLRECPILISAPIASNALRCRSIGRLPIMHPPGRAIFACPIFAKSGPMIRKDALILLISS